MGYIIKQVTDDGGEKRLAVANTYDLATTTWQGLIASGIVPGKRREWQLLNEANEIYASYGDRYE